MNTAREIQKILAVDGPSGSGKSTVAKRVAQQLGYLYVDTGAMFRALGHVADQENLSLTWDEVSIEKWLPTIDFRYGVSESCLVEVNGQNLTHKIREHHASSLASQISRLPVVRNYLLHYQRQLVKDQFCTMEGRDIGTVVFPNAFCKIFLTASPEVRANRRFLELRRNDPDITFEQIFEDLVDRDESDSGRKIAPLKPAIDAWMLDSSILSIDEVVEMVCTKAKHQAHSLGID